MNLKKHIVIIDFDGVLNTIGTFIRQGHTDNSRLYKRGSMSQFESELEPGLVKLLDYMLDKLPDAVVVISSNWRKYYTIAQLRIGLRSMGLKKRNSDKILDTTPIRADENRAKEIIEFFDLNMHYNKLQIAIIDDKPVFDDVQALTNPLTGITIQDVKKVLDILEVPNEIELFTI